MGHTMEVDDHIWEWGRRQSGRINPASWLRRVLDDAHRAQGEELVAAPSRWANGRPVLDGDDPGTVITVERDAICAACLTLIPSGERALYRRNSRGNRETHHLSHFAESS